MNLNVTAYFFSGRQLSDGISLQQEGTKRTSRNQEAASAHSQSRRQLTNKAKTDKRRKTAKKYRENYQSDKLRIS
jgi:hypothetical protein